jgi:gliding motility-associated-like protein
MICRSKIELRYLVSVLLLVVYNSSFSQKEASVWYFGKEIGIDFNQSPPALLTDGMITYDGVGTNMESAASIADENGQLLFYTNGMTVWNRLNEVMFNGTDLYGENTTTQTLIVPKPVSSTLLYIFTASPEGDHEFFPSDKRGFWYSVVDISKNNGLGEVIEKNTLLSVSTTEKMAATRHANGKDVWVVMHEWGNDVFRSYLVTENGIDLAPVYSSTGLVHRGPEDDFYGWNAIGQMKISPNGERLALALYRDQVFEVFQFDPVSGKVHSMGSVSLFPEAGLLYGVEFSPGGRYLYITSTGPTIYQLDLEGEVSRDRLELIIDGPPYPQLCQLQLGIDGRIYVANYQSQRIGVIHAPEKPGEECGYESNGIEIPTGDGKWCMLGLPNFISSYFLNTELYPLPPYFEMPNVFTPNGDGYNDRFVPMVNYNVVSGTLAIYNRWGEQVLQTTNLESGWDGGECSPGVYYWIVRYLGTNGRSYFQKGTVQLIR